MRKWHKSMPKYGRDAKRFINWVKGISVSTNMTLHVQAQDKETALFIGLLGLKLPSIGPFKP